MDGIRIRTAFPQDSEQIRDIYAPYVEKTAITFETEVPTVTEMIHRMENVIWRYPYLVIEDGESILGYAYASPFIGRAAYDWSVEMSIYLRMDERRHRLGKMLYQKMEDVLRAQGILNLNACIAVPKAHDSGYKFGRWYDMVWMEKILGEHKTPADPVRPFQEVCKDFGLEPGYRY